MSNSSRKRNSSTIPKPSKKPKVDVKGLRRKSSEVSNSELKSFQNLIGLGESLQKAPRKDAPQNDAQSKALQSSSQKFSDLYRRVDSYMEGVVVGYKRLKQFHSVVKEVKTSQTGKKEKRNVQVSVFSLLYKRNCPYEIFVKAVQKKVNWIPGFIPDQDLLSIFHTGEELGWAALLRDPRLVVNQSSDSKAVTFEFVTLKGSHAKFNDWQFKAVPSSFQHPKGLDILCRTFGLCYSNFFAKIAARRAISPLNSKELGDMTGHSENLFDDIGKATIVIAGVDFPKLKSLYEEHLSAPATTAKKRKLKTEVLKYFIDNFGALQKKKIVKDFSLMFPKTFQNILKKSLQ